MNYRQLTQAVSARQNLMDPCSLPMDQPSQPNPPPRPSFNDPLIVDAVVRNLTREVSCWFEGEPDTDIEEALRDALKYSNYGFERAVRLKERWGWECNSELVEILENADGLTESSEAVVAWVAANGITPKFSVGDRVRTKVSSRGKVQEAVISGVRAKEAMYIVQTDEWRTIRPDQPPVGSGCMVPFEWVAAIETEGDGK